MSDRDSHTTKRKGHRVAPKVGWQAERSGILRSKDDEPRR